MWTFLDDPLPAVSLMRCMRARLPSLSLRGLLLLVVFFLASTNALAALANWKLSAPMLNDRDVETGWALSPDGDYAVFMADARVNDQYELFSVRLAGSSPLLISGTLAANEDVSGFLVSNGEPRVVFSTTLLNAANPNRLWSVPITGGTPIPLTPSMTDDDYIERYILSPDGAYAVFLVKNLTADLQTLYSAPVNGGSPVPLYSKDCEFCGISSDFLASPNSDKVVFRHVDGYGSTEIGIAPITGGLVVTDIGTNVGSFALSPDNLRIVFTNHDPFSGEFWINVASLATGVDTGNLRYLHSPTNLAVSPDNLRFIYIDEGMLFSVQFSSSELTPTNLSGPMATGGQITGVQMTPDGEYAIYLADQRSNDDFELFGVLLDGSASKVLLSGNLVDNGDVTAFQVTPNSQAVVYMADKDTDDQVELYIWPPAIGGDGKLNGTFSIATGDVASLAVSPNSGSVLYRADPDVDERFELYAWITGAGGGSTIQVNGTLIPVGGHVEEFLFTKDSAGALYRASQEVGGKNELYITHEPYEQRVYLPVVIR
jgi:Tol biopolymer transport system component